MALYYSDSNKNLIKVAGNLGEQNVEHSEVIYDKDSSDSNINWGYTSGISGVFTKNIDLSKFSRLRIFVNNYEHGGITEFDVKSYPYNNSSGMTTVYSFVYDGGFYLYKIECSYKENILAFVTNRTSYVGVLNTMAGGYIYKIEGVY